MPCNASRPNLVITERTIYPILAKLKREGLLISEPKDTGSGPGPGPTRRYYSSSPAEEQMRDEMGQYWQDLAGSIGKL